MKSVHRYSFQDQLYFWMYNVAAFFWIGFSLIIGLPSALRAEIDQVLVGSSLFFLGLFFLYSGHSHPEIISDQDGLLVQFCFWHLRVRWIDIVEVKPIKWNIFINPMMKNFSDFPSFLVKTRVLTPFHRLFDLQGLSLQPSFIFHYNISGRDELRSSIQQKKLIQTSEKLAV